MAYLARSSSIATAGRTLPSHEFEECAATSGDVGDFVSDTEQVDCCQGVTTACDRERFAVCDSVSNNFSPFTEVREFEHANRTVPQDSFCVFQDFSQFLCRNVARSRICSSSLMSFTDFRVAVAVSENSVATRTSVEPGYHRYPAGVWLRQPGLLHTGIYQRCGPGAATKVFAIPPPTISWSAIFRQGIQNGQFGRNFRTT